jgi:hypothetical protein
MWSANIKWPASAEKLGKRRFGDPAWLLDEDTAHKTAATDRGHTGEFECIKGLERRSTVLGMTRAFLNSRLRAPLRGGSPEDGQLPGATRVDRPHRPQRLARLRPREVGAEPDGRLQQPPQEDGARIRTEDAIDGRPSDERAEVVMVERHVASPRQEIDMDTIKWQVMELLAPVSAAMVVAITYLLTAR